MRYKKGAFFVVTTGPKTGSVIVIDKKEMIVGRDNSADIVLKEKLMSRNHIKIKSTDKQITVKDLGSTNGTYVNNKAIHKKSLKDGDEIQVGDLILKFFQEDLQSKGKIMVDDHQMKHMAIYGGLQKNVGIMPDLEWAGEDNFF